MRALTRLLLNTSSQGERAALAGLIRNNKWIGLSLSDALTETMFKGIINYLSKLKC